MIDVCGNKLQTKIKVNYEGEKEAKKDPKSPQYDPKYRRVDIKINGVLVLSLVAGG